MNKDELFPRLTAEGIQATVGALVTCTARQASDDILDKVAPKWDSQEGLLWYEIRETLSTCNKRMAEVIKLAKENKLRAH